jgi:hypothetical protein
VSSEERVRWRVMSPEEVEVESNVNCRECELKGNVT